MSEGCELRHRLINLIGGQTVLSGAISGRTLLSALIAATPFVAIPTPAFLDFMEIEVATASFLREAVIGFRDFARQSLGNVYPVVANLAPSILKNSNSSFAPAATCCGAANSVRTTMSSAPD